MAKKKAEAPEGAAPEKAPETKPAEGAEAAEPKKRKPAADGAEKAPAAAKAKEAGGAAPGESTKKKGRRPGVSPHRGKKLRSQMKSQRQKLAK
jgi:hypothetical protein